MSSWSVGKYSSCPVQHDRIHTSSSLVLDSSHHSHRYSYHSTIILLYIYLVPSHLGMQFTCTIGCMPHSITCFSVEHIMLPHVLNASCSRGVVFPMRWLPSEAIHDCMLLLELCANIASLAAQYGHCNNPPISSGIGFHP